METKTVKYKDQTLAHFFFHQIRADGVKFLTPDSYTLQVGLIEHPAGKVIRDHIHRQDIKYNVDTTQEFLYIEKGTLLIKLFGPNWETVEEVEVNSGDFVLFVGGGHGLEVKSDCRIVEVKQGPYPGEQNAKLFRE